MSEVLPPELTSVLDRLAQGLSRRAIARRAHAISERYRAGIGSAEAIQEADDALAYAFTRLPATYAAVTAVLAAVQMASPDFSPRTLIDAGAGPGTAAWAAAQQFGGLADVLLIDDNPHLRALGEALLASSPVAGLREATYSAGDVVARLPGGALADLVIASYVVGELAPERLIGAGDALWSATRAMLVLVEPGTPAGFARIRDLRAHLIGCGAHVIAPCPHDAPCPIVAPDWCHFAQRLARSRDHQRAKGAALSYEDEKFSYVVLARDAPPRIDARVLALPRVGKAGVAVKLCTAEGILTDVTPRRDRTRYKARSRWRWGDAVSRSGGTGEDAPIRIPS